MKTILVDDMLLDLRLFEIKCADMKDINIVGKFTDPLDAIAYAEKNVVDFAILDIDMPGMNGMELAQQLRALRSDIIIVFATAHTKFAVNAIKMKADYIIFKPFDEDDIADVIQRAKLLRMRQKKRYYFHTFGPFDMTIDGVSVKFRSARAKELMAFLVYREGNPVSIHDIIWNLWGDGASSRPENTGYRRIIKDLADTMKDYNAGELLCRNRGSIQVLLDLTDSDYHDFMNENMDAVCKFQGSFMSQYSWAETAIYELQERKKLLLHNN